MDYATLQKGYETLSKAALSGDRLTMEESIKDWNSLYKARQEMRGHEEEAFNKGQEEFEKEENDPGFKEAHHDGKSIEEVAHKAEQQLRKEEEKAAKMSAKEISKKAEKIIHGNER